MKCACGFQPKPRLMPKVSSIGRRLVRRAATGKSSLPPPPERGDEAAARTVWLGQPRGLPEGIRRSPSPQPHGDLRITAQQRPCTPIGRARPASERGRLGQGVALAPRWGARIRTRLSGGRSPLALNDHRLPSGNPPGWPRHRMGGGPAALHLCGLMSAVNAGFIVCILASLPRNALRLPDHPFQRLRAGVSAIDLGHAAEIAEQAVGRDFAGVGTRRQPLG